MTVPALLALAGDGGASGAAPSVSADEPLGVVLSGGRLVISIGINTLAFAVTAGGGWKGAPFKVVDAAQAAADILRELRREEEDGTTPVHELLDKAAEDAWENGGEGFREDADDE